MERETMAMDAEQAKAFFKRADDLYNAGQFTDALRILAELNKAFPNQKNVIWPSALCLGKLGRHEEAIRACDILVAQHGDVRAADLRERLAAHRQGTVTPPPLPRADMLDGPIGLDAIDAMLDRPDPPARVARKAETDYKKIGLIAGGVVLALLLFVAPLMSSRGSTEVGSSSTTLTEGQKIWLEDHGFPKSEIDKTTPRETEVLMAIAAAQEDPSSENLVSMFGVLLRIHEPTWGKLIVFLILLSYLMTAFSYGPALFASLAILKKLPSDDLQENLTEVSISTLLYSLLAQTFIGILAIPFLIARRFELSVGETFICMILNSVFGSIFGWILWQLFFWAIK